LEVEILLTIKARTISKQNIYKCINKTCTWSHTPHASNWNGRQEDNLEGANRENWFRISKWACLKYSNVPQLACSFEFINKYSRGSTTSLCLF
jgi:hypothetical protein